MFGSLQLVPRAYVCCEHEATENVGLLNKKDVGLESGCAHAYLAGGPGQATLPSLSLFPLLSKRSIRSYLEHLYKDERK